MEGRQPASFPAAQSWSGSTFSPAAPRQSSIALLRNVGTGDHRIVTSISTRKSTEVLRINLRTGRLELENDAWSESSYENESEALDHLQSRGYEVSERGYALLGYAAAGATAGVLLATRVREKAVLPGGHTVYAVTDSAWAMVPLQNEAADAAAAAALAGLPLPRADGEFWRTMQQFTLNNAHYYCETADISRPFPSDRDPRDPAPEFVWNSWLRQPLLELGLYDHCPVLLQGAVECSTQQLPGCTTKFSMCLVSRRSRRHPGTRYIARGLNGLAGPGNEIECELLTWTHPEQQHFGGSSLAGAAPAFPGGGMGSVHGHSAGGGAAVREGCIVGSAGFAGAGRGSSGEPLRWARVVWRRGTVPIWWGVQLQSLAQGLQAEVYVREDHPYEGTASYFRNVQRQHQPRPALPATAASEQAAAGEGGGGGGSEGWTLVDQAGAEASSGSSSARTSVFPASSAARAAVAGPGGGESEQDASCQVPVTCINLLHANPKKASELMLSSHFQDAMRHVRRRLGSAAPIKVVNFDWHGNMGRLTEEKAVEGFWSLMEPFVKQTGFAWGWMEPAHPQMEQPSSNGSSSSAAAAEAAVVAGGGGGITAAAPSTAWLPSWRMRWGGQQAGLLRFNCADSLDRTNAATCFAMLPVLQEQLRVLGIPLESAVPPATAALMRSRQRSSAGDVAALASQQPGGLEAQEAAAAAALPEGWEVRQHEGRLLYIDHINKTTQWAPPAALGSSDASGSSTPGGARGRRPGSAGLSSRMMQSASDMLARLQQRSGPVPGGSAAAGSGQRATALLNLERRSSPPRDGGSYAAGAGASSGGSAHGGSFFSHSRNNSSGNLAAVSHAASAPDMTLPPSRPSTASEGASSPQRSTQQQDPLCPWAFFSYDINDVRERLARDAVSDYVEMFRVHGDIHSFLYTGSPAMHSHVLALVVQGGKGYGAASGVGKLQNLRVAVQRRWNNTVSDTSRQQAMELFLGLRIHDRGDQKGYFPGLQLAYQDSTQARLGGLEPFEFAPLPPASHSRHSSNVPSAWGPLGSGAPAADAAAAAAAAAVHRLPLLEEEGSVGMSASLEQAAGTAAPQQQEQQPHAASWEQYDHAHAVPGVFTVQHDGRLGVQQSLLDLEPLPDGELPYEQQMGDSLGDGSHQRSSSGGSSSAGGGGSSRLANSSGEPSVASLPLEAGSLACSSGNGEKQAAEPAPPTHFDPLGAVPHPAGSSPEQQQAEQQQGQGWAGDLLSLGEDDGSCAAAIVDGGSGTAATTPSCAGGAEVRSQLEDLLL